MITLSFKYALLVRRELVQALVLAFVKANNNSDPSESSVYCLPVDKVTKTITIVTL